MTFEEAEEKAGEFLANHQKQNAAMFGWPEMSPADMLEQLQMMCSAKEYKNYIAEWQSGARP